jgi:hypothetical protein
MALADAVFETPARRSATEGIAACPSAASATATGGPVPITPAVSGRGDGRVAGKGGAATFTLPPTPEPPHFALRRGGLIYRGHDKT